ncbi:NAD(P)/FAD-dependent oxidoreductase [Terrihabitans sp. B22-R8]|uniref:NAD(P)/FAD-dependent oxidoreductase n=1 Tax=Terrihabitans sp. B22-R8 TaxID=3425128 RepID=UPI00403CF18D
MRHDVIVIGGSYAGMAATLQLVRARRKVLVIDAGQRRNRFAAHSHGFIGHDGEDPAEIARKAREQLMAYPTLSWREGLATGAAAEKGGFAVTTADGEVHHGARLILALGVSDQLPEIDGLAERWGRSVFLCPYCHGYELDMGRIGVIATGPMALHQAALLTEWGEVTLFLNRSFKPEAAEWEQAVERGITIEPDRIADIEGHADVRLEDGRVLPFAGLFTKAENAPSTPIADALGCELEETPFGTHILTKAHETSVPGVFACGDAAHVPHSVSIAVGNGALTGAFVHRSLVF